MFKLEVVGISHMLLFKCTSNMLVEWGQGMRHYEEWSQWWTELFLYFTNAIQAI